MSSLHIQKYTADAGHENTTKPILILLHGGALSHRMYKDVVPLLTAQGYDIYTPDLPGHGSSVPSGPFTFQKATDLVQSAIGDIKKSHGGRKLLLVGVSLGGQVVLDVLQKYPASIDAAIVSGAFIHPPTEASPFNLPRMPTDKAWLDLMIEDVNKMGMENASGIQEQSFAFRFQPPKSLPPVLVVVGEDDVAICNRDFAELSEMTCATNVKSRDLVLKSAWHNHPIDIPERFAEVINKWAGDALAQS